MTSSPLTPAPSRAATAARWRALLADADPPAGYELWLVVPDVHDHPSPVVLALEGLPEAHDDRFLDQVAQLAVRVVAEEAPGTGRCAAALVRPAPPGVRAADVGWADGLLRAARRYGLRLAGVDLVVGRAVVPLV
ncbi:hypothetical protein [Kineococcus sp. SYSU DK004]|uniref:hypothetical protein n=1 Tax=Kineococcus sp. SYSU DK004 TaxID=3383125 RepID=UPI003D7E1392